MKCQQCTFSGGEERIKSILGKSKAVWAGMSYTITSKHKGLPSNSAYWTEHENGI